MKKLRNIAMILFFVIAILLVGVCSLYNYNLTPIDKNDSTKIEVEIPSGSSVKSIGELLEEKGLIRNSKFFYLYSKLYKINDMKATTYSLSKDMALEEIINTLRAGNNYNPDEISITFNEGINIRKVAKIIEANTNNSYDDVFTLLEDEEYLNSLINEYWFITDEIKNNEIYYPLEGYLYPNTYKFKNKDVSIKEIFKTMLDESDKILSNYKSVINSSKYTLHEILTLASIVELEGVNANDRNGIAAVFINRLESNWSLGSDVTTYYGAKVEMSERDLYKSEIDAVNAYNTRSSAMAGKLPVGPIANVSEDSIKAVLYPVESDYYYFVADKYGNVHFTKTYSEHLAKISELKNEGAWIEW